MPQVKYQVTLAVDGKHAVSVASDDAAAVIEGLVTAQEIYRKLQRLGPSNGIQSHGVELRVNANPTPQVEPEEKEICGIHNVPMVWQPGRKGYFWSCHIKNEDDSWCTYRPAKKPIPAAALPF
jgi:hypothetical protein